MGVGARVKTFVTDRDIKQKKIAAEIGISDAKLSHYLTERYEMPTHVLAAISQYLNVSSDYFLGLTDDPHRPMSLSESERQLILSLRTLSKDQKELVAQSVLLMQKQNQR